jgi:hypothetical protein
MTIRTFMSPALFLATALAFAGCATDAVEDQPDDSEPTAARVDMTPWTGAPRAEVAEVLKLHGGVQISENQVAWDDGKVVLTIPDEAHPENDREARASWHGCPKGWYCFYQHQNWGGRKLQFSDCPSGGKSQWLTDYGFGNQTTSWVVNRNLNFVNVNDEDNNGWNLWNEDGNSASSNVGAADNDQADWFICYG